jgi:hypothetical protein
MKVKITKSSDPLLWYTSKIGQIFEVERVGEVCYWTREDNYWNCLNIIRKSDAIVITEKENE